MREQCYLNLKVMYKYLNVDKDIADRNWTSKSPAQPLSRAIITTGDKEKRS